MRKLLMLLVLCGTLLSAQIPTNLLNAYEHYTPIEQLIEEQAYYETISPLKKLANYHGHLKDFPIFSPINSQDINRVSDWFGHRKRHPILQVPTTHRGIDITGEIGTPIVAVADGTVVEAKYSRIGYGNRVSIHHANGYNTLYAHLDSIKVNIGDRVNIGDTIATLGSSGMSTGPHLHYEIRKHGVAIDPVSLHFELNDPQAKEKYIASLEKVNNFYLMFN
jgi:murein DD-endopeptidase MepM/ murein hydrolase activator NlpD